MNKKIILIFLILLSSFAYAECPPDCPDEELNEYDHFVFGFSSDPVSLAENNPEFYARYIKENPNIANEYPEVYENFISKDIRRLNQNKEAFKAYALSKGAQFTTINSDFKSFDLKTKQVQTLNSKGEESSLISLYALDEMARSKQYSNFKIDSEGRLSYQRKFKGNTNTISIKGKMAYGDKIELRDSLITTNEGVISISGKNSASIDLCKNCGYLEINAVESPIALPSGVLLRGNAKLYDEGDIVVEENYLLLRESGTIYESEGFSPVRITSKTCFDGPQSCIQDSPGNKLLIKTPFLSRSLKITTHDGTYDKIIVQKMSLYEKQKVVLRIKKDFTNEKGKDVEFTFRNGEPLMRGDPSGLKSSIYHIFEKDSEEYPWIVSQNGKNTNVGEITTNLRVVLESSIQSKDIKKFIDLVETKGSVESEQVRIVLESSSLEKEQLEILAKFYTSSKIYEFPPAAVSSRGKNFETFKKTLFYLEMKSTESDLSPLLVSIDEDIQEMKTVNPYHVDSFLRLYSDSSDKQLEVLSKTEVIVNPAASLFFEELSSDEVKREYLLKRKVFDDHFPDSVKSYFLTGWNYFKEIEKLDPELRELALRNLDLQDKRFGSRTPFENFRVALYLAKDKPELMKELFDKMPAIPQKELNPKILKKVYFNPYFEQETKKLDFANKYSVALTAQRYLERSGQEPTSDNIEKVTKMIINQRKDFSKKVILGKKTHLIPIAYGDSYFNLRDMIKVARDAGVSDVVTGLKGRNDLEYDSKLKRRILESVKNSKGKTQTVIYFNDHGSPNDQALFPKNSKVPSSERAISYKNLGDALAERGNLNEVTILVSSCWSKNYKDNLYNYLDKVKGVKKMPTVVTATNRGEQDAIYLFPEALKKKSQKGKPLTGADIYKIESYTFNFQDLSITTPTTSKEESPFVNKKTPKVIDMGSTNDEGKALPPKKPKRIPKPLSPTYIEIGQADTVKGLS